MKQLSNSHDVVEYPAAHSMDTEWFAVDANGHIALFDSGEVGSVPEVEGALGYQSVRTDLLPYMPSNELGHTVLDIDALKLFSAFYEPRDEYAETGLLIEIVPGYEEELVPLVGEWGYVLHFERSRNWYFVYNNEETIRSLPWVLNVKEMEIASVLGFYVYESPENYAASFPYEKKFSPKNPMQLSVLNEEGQTHLKTVEFLWLYFRKKSLLQPFEHMPSATHQAYWVDCDGTRHDA